MTRHFKKAGLGYTLEGRDPFLRWTPAFRWCDGILDVSIGPLSPSDSSESV